MINPLLDTTALREMKWWMTTRQMNKMPVFLPRESVQIILSEYFNDKNSSSLREDMTLRAVGLTQNPQKLGYDAVEGNVEVKPQNVEIGGIRKLNGGGNFTDFTWKRHEKYLGDSVTMLTSGFVEGTLVYVLKFPYINLVNKIVKQLYKRFPDGDKIGQYLRSAHFVFKDYNIGGTSVQYLSEDFHEFKPQMTKKVFKFLEFWDKPIPMPPEL